MSWSDRMVQASFRGFLLEIESITDSITRRFAEHKYPWRNGADIDDMGREPRKTTIAAVFQGSDYEDDLNNYIRLVDEGVSGTFQHPLFGSWNAKCNITNISHQPDDRDCAKVDMEFIEDGTSTKIPEINSIQKLSDEVDGYADDVISLSTSTEAVKAANSAKSLVANVTAGVANIESNLNQMRKYVDDSIATITDNETLVAINRMAYSAQQLSERYSSIVQQAVEFEVPVEMPLDLVTHRFYGDISKSTEMMRNNAIRNPFTIKSGTKLRIYQ